MTNEPVKIELKTKDGEPSIYVVDQDGKELVRVDYDDQLDEAIHRILKAVCKRVGITFTGLAGY